MPKCERCKKEISEEEAKEFDNLCIRCVLTLSKAIPLSEEEKELDKQIQKALLEKSKLKESALEQRALAFEGLKILEMRLIGLMLILAKIAESDKKTLTEQDYEVFKMFIENSKKRLNDISRGLTMIEKTLSGIGVSVGDKPNP